jgi:hypothetical protein
MEGSDHACGRQVEYSRLNAARRTEDFEWPLTIWSQTAASTRRWERLAGKRILHLPRLQRAVVFGWRAVERTEHERTLANERPG